MIGFVVTFYTIIILVLFFYSLHSFILLYYFFKFKLNKKNVLTKTKDFKKIAPLPVITVQLPVYNEKFVVRRLISNVLNLNYPKDKLEIQILDDSDDETTTIVENIVRLGKKEGYDIKHLRRKKRKGFKAGALQYGLKLAKGEFIAIFDADFVPPRNFLTELIPDFSSPEVGGVQARWGHLNSDSSFLTKAQAIALDNHFAMEQELRSKAGFFINFNGTCGIWRKSAIIDAGGWHSDTLAEDLDLSYRVQLRGWKIVYRGDFVVPGELPETVDSFRIQQNRWAKGTFQVACKLLKMILQSRLRPLAKYEAFVHLTGHINFVAMLFLGIFSLPIVYFKVERLVPEGYYIFLSFFTIGAIGYPLLYFLSQKEFYQNYKRKIPYISGVIAYSMGLSVSNTKAIIEGLLKKNNIFTRTPKSGGTKQTYSLEKKLLIPGLETLLGCYVLLALIYVIMNFQLVLIPFLLFYSFGFLSLGISSLKEKILIWRFKEQEVLCSSRNS
ncbi:MAG: glycosyltransferase [candidate division WOR-3 bacterium]